MKATRLFPGRPWLLAMLTVSVIFPCTLEAQVTFTDVTDSAAAGLSATTTRGIAWVDFNNDGYPDLFVPTSGSSANKLYRNNGDGTFTDVAAAVGLNDISNTVTCSWGDFDNDGDLDLVVTITSGATKLWRNNLLPAGDTTFTDISATAGMSLTGGQMPAWADFNGDGYLDFYVPVASTTVADALYRNNHDATFTNVSDSAGVNHQVSGVSEQAITWGDYDKDGYPDLFIGNLTGSSFLHHNNGNGTFTDVAATLGVQGAARGAQWIDYNNDGLWDLCIAGYAGATTLVPIKLFRNNGNGTFTDVAAAAGITDGLISWGVTCADYDNDGYEDIFVNAFGQSTSCVLYKNNGNGTFTNVTASAGLAGLTALSAVWGDYKGDGTMDLYTSGTGTTGNHLFRCNGDPSRNWLKVNLVDTAGNRFGVGAQIEVHAGTLHMMREVNTGIGYRSQNMMTAHFGLNSATLADSVIVRWPSGPRTILTNIAANQTVTIARTPGGSSTVTVNVALDAGWNMISNPVTNAVPDDSARHLFPTIVSSVFRFSGGYVAGEVMTNGIGYWGKFPAATANPLTGTARTHDSISVVAGWNMIGSISNPVDTSTITSVPPGIRASNWFGFSGGYAPVTQIVPGKAYWVKASAAGKFVFANPPLNRPAEGATRKFSDVKKLMMVK